MYAETAYVNIEQQIEDEDDVRKCENVTCRGWRLIILWALLSSVGPPIVTTILMGPDIVTLNGDRNYTALIRNSGVVKCSRHDREAALLYEGDCRVWSLNDGEYRIMEWIVLAPESGP